MGVNFESHKSEILDELHIRIEKGLEECGIGGEGYAVEYITKVGAIDSGNLRNSITHKVRMDEQAVYIGTPVEYGKYVELGTGKYAEGGRSTPWTYQDENGNWHKTEGMKPRPFIKPAIANHLEDYKATLEDALKGL